MDRAARTVMLQGGGTLFYDRLLLNIGSEATRPFALDALNVWPIKPISGLAEFRAALEAERKPQPVLVIGGGAAGCECTANLLALALKKLDLRLTIVIAVPRRAAPRRAAPRLLPDWPEGRVRRWRAG